MADDVVQSVTPLEERAYGEQRPFLKSMKPSLFCVLNCALKAACATGASGVIFNIVINMEDTH